MKSHIRADKCLAALVGIFLISVGVAFNAMARLGNDPVGIFYDGIRNALGLTQMQLGSASNLVNLSLAVLLFFTGKRYLNIGTLIYILPYGVFVNAGSVIYTWIFQSEALWCRVSACITGCFLLYLGVAIYITVDIGLDPMTGMAMVIRDKLHWDYKKAKWLFDGTLTLVGFLLGGKLGVITIVAALSGGPVIQYIAEKLTGIQAIRKERAYGA